MNPSILPSLSCPAGCESELTLHANRLAGMDEVVSGALTCSECHREYPIEKGIVRMLPSELCSSHDSGDHAVSRKRTEMRARDSQVKDYERMWYLNLFGLLEIPVTLRQLRLSGKDRLLEAGCGTGRMTRSFASKCSRLGFGRFQLGVTLQVQGQAQTRGNSKRRSDPGRHLPSATQIGELRPRGELPGARAYTDAREPEVGGQ